MTNSAYRNSYATTDERPQWIRETRQVYQKAVVIKVIRHVALFNARSRYSNIHSVYIIESEWQRVRRSDRRQGLIEIFACPEVSL